MKKIFSNKEIIEQINLIYENFQVKDDLFLPIKINYALQMNYKILSERGESFDDMKEKITQKYGYFSNEEGKYILKQEKVAEAQNEFDDFLNMKQEIEILTISLNDLEKCKMNTKQMMTLLFMID